MIPEVQLESKSKRSVSFLNLFRFSTQKERFFLVFACFFALAGGAAFPLFALVFGGLTNSLAPTGVGQQNSKIIDDASTYSADFIYIGIGVFICNFISMGVFLNVSEKISGRIRKAYYEAVLRQNIGWFDSLNPNELASKMSIETYTIQQGIGDKIPQFLMAFATIIAGFVMGFSQGWELTLVLCGVLPFLGIGGGLYGWILANIKKKINEAYVTSAGLAEQCLNAIKTVKSLSSEDFELMNFSLELKKSNKVILKYGLLVGFSMGFIYFIIFSNYALAFWFGSVTLEKRWYNSVTHSTYDVGNVITVFFSVTIASVYFAQLGPPFKSFTAAKQSAANVFDIIDRVPEILNDDKTKKIAQNIHGDICFKNVEFSYPSRKDVQVLKNVTIKIEENKKTAFVGESGSGKSTIVALIERFYDPTSGLITIDEIDLKEYNLSSIRRNIGYVGQEPILFSGTVKENLLFGKEDATDDEMMEALKKAEAYSFVQNLPKKLDTMIGIGGNQLSGGQKQRLAIARAILKNPSILLLDEATSALDRTNEKEIQMTLDKISAAKTTIVIAHRLSTIQDADKIYVMNNGNIEDYGTHEELLFRGGRYEALVKIQLMGKEEKNEEEVLKEEKEKIMETETELTIPCEKSKGSIISLQIIPEENSHLNRVSLKRRSHHEMIVKQEFEEIQMVISQLTKKDLDVKKKKVFKRLMHYILKHPFTFIGAVLGSIINGGIPPLMAIVFGEMLQTLALYWLPDFRGKVDFLAGMFVVIAGGAFFANLFQSYLYAVLGEKISYELKFQVYDKIIRKPLKFFDEDSNNPGILSAKISIDTQQVNSLASSFIGIVIQGFAGFIVGMIVAFCYSWQITLVALGLSPLIVASQSYQAKTMTGFQKEDESYKTSAAIIMESVTNIRTVASFCKEKKFQNKYNEQVDIPIKAGARKGIRIGLAFGGSFFLLFAYYAIVFYIAAVLQDREGLTLQDFFVALFAIIMAASATGISGNFLPDVAECVIAGEQVFTLLDSQDQENYVEQGNFENLINNFQGRIEFKNVYFKYPLRENYLFENFNLVINPGKKVALVGPSGCGNKIILIIFLRFKLI